MRRRFWPLLWVLVFVLACAGCGTTAKFTYPPNECAHYTARDSHTSRVAVLMAPDARPADNTNLFWLSFIPVVPIGTASYARPEAARQFVSIAEYEMDASKDVALAVADEFKRSRLFPNAFFSYGGDVAGAYVCELTLRKFEYDGTAITYGLSVYGSLLWMLGLPAGTSTCDVEAEMALRDPGGAAVWSGFLRGSDSVTQGLYYSMGRDAIGFATVIEREMQRLLPEIERATGSMP